MRIDGRLIAAEVLANLAKRVGKLKEKGTTPTMAIILVGNNEASNIYVKQKIKKGEEIGAEVKLFRFQSPSQTTLISLIEKLDKDPKIHGIIIQRPAPANIDADKLNEQILPIKEVDGFGSKSIYPVPVAKSCWKLLESVFQSEKKKSNFSKWLRSRKIIIIGKGITAGRPIINHFEKNKIPIEIVDSKTKNKDYILKSADIIITAVGKRILNSSQVKKGVILVGVGLFTDQNGKLRGDYDDSRMEKVAGFYSPTPGGVGPLNVACLLENLVKSAESTL